METFQFGPLSVDVEYIGLMPPPWSKYAPPERRYNVTVSDQHGHVLETGWSSEVNEEKSARTIVEIMAYAQSEGRNWDFYGGYTGEERRWRSDIASRVQEALKQFNEREIYRAAGIAWRQDEYEKNRGPKDWSPIRELREES